MDENWAVITDNGSEHIVEWFDTLKQAEGAFDSVPLAYDNRRYLVQIMRERRA